MRVSSVGRREVELERDEALARADLEVLEDVLVARVVGDDELKPGWRLDQLACLVDGQYPPVVGQRVNHHHGVLARFDDLIEIAEGARPHGPRQRSVLPHRLARPHEVAADEVAGGEIVVAGDGDPRPAKAPRHVLDEAGLAAAGRPLEHDREPARVTGLEDGHLAAHRQVEGLLERRRPHAVEESGRHRTPRGRYRGVHGRRAQTVEAAAGRTGSSFPASTGRPARKKKSQRKSATPATKSAPVAMSIRKWTWSLSCVSR